MRAGDPQIRKRVSAMQRIWTGLLSLLLLAAGVRADDWPHWLGPHRDGSSPETGLLTTWPSTGPKILWKARGGEGYSSVAVADGRAITLVQRDGSEIVTAFDAVKGKPLWSVPIASAYKNDYGNGPRSTPSIDGNLVFVQSATGPLVCLKTDNGDIVWKKDILKDFGGKNLTWGLSASPFILGDVLVALPGAKGASVAVFNKKTGDLVWKAGSDEAAYATPIIVTVGGERQIIVFNAAGLVALNPNQGKELWRVPWVTEFKCNIATPLVVGDLMFVSSGESVGCAVFKLKADSAPDVLWQTKGKKSVMTNYWATSVVHDGHLYGFSGEFDKRIDLNCVELTTGKLKWSQKDFGKGAVTLADGHLFITTKKGDLVLVRATPERYEEKGRVTALGENRTVPTLAHKRLYLRDKENIYCLDVGAGN
jgi:outer membrane protein assembly factor BamB